MNSKQSPRQEDNIAVQAIVMNGTKLNGLHATAKDDDVETIKFSLVSLMELVLETDLK